jgi:hypothetical protein
MADQTALDEVFRFVHLHAAHAVSFQPSLKRTQFNILLEPASPDDRVSIAISILGGSSPEVARAISDLTLGEEIHDALIRALEGGEATVADFLGLLPDNISLNPHFETDLHILSDTLLLSAYAPTLAPAELDAMRRLYIAYLVIEATMLGTLPSDTALRALVNQPVVPLFDESDLRLIRPKIRSVGVADLLVVKQHIKRYETSELAHVENIMPKETRSRDHRKLERFDETITVETESTTEKEEELTSTERFELEQETSRTIKEDQKYAFDLSVSGQMGPVVEFDSGFEMEITRSDEAQARNAMKYSKDVVQRSLERVKERVRHERVRRIIQETEERNLHSFINESDKSIWGQYQFLDKVYEAQVFNYGKRQMFDLMIPEPASYLLYLERTSATKRAELPPAPDPLTIAPLDLKFEHSDADLPTHYTQLAAKYGASGLETPPPLHRRATIKHVAPAGTATPGAASERGDVSVPPTVLEFSVPDGYRPRTAYVYSLALTNNVDRLNISFAIATATDNEFMDTTLHRTHVGGNDVEGQLYIVGGNNELTFNFSDPHVQYESESKLHLSIMPFDTANHAIVCEVEFERTDNHLDNWKLKTYDAIRSAYQSRLLEYADEVARAKAELKAEEDSEERKLGAPPSARRQTIVTELKKHFVAILRQQWFTDPSPMRVVGDNPPTFDFVAAQQMGSLVRFLEHAFEWDQIQYAFYPYFWARMEEWASQFNKEDPDYEFQQFLQAGTARVVLAVRPGFEAAVSYFLETGRLWEGRGEPTVSDPLYWSIVEEIRARTDGRLDAIPVGEPWEVRLPTTLILLRPQDATPLLPHWQRAEDGAWSWSPADGTEDA